MIRSPRGKILKYDHQDLENAVRAVERGESIRQAAKTYNVPKSTIGDRLSGRFDVTVPSVHGRPPAIPKDIEDKIVSSEKKAAEMGVGLSRQQLLNRTNTLCKRLKLKTSYANFHAGKDWWQGVRRRHPELTLRKPEKLSTVRARMLNQTVVGSYYDALEKIVSELNVSGNEIWNCDETGLNFEHTPGRVVTVRGAKSVVGKTSQKSSNLTIMACVNGSGSTMPPLIITKGKTNKSIHGFKTTDAPPGTVWSYQEKGWFTDDIGEQWFDSVFLRHCGPKRPQLLIFDGHSSHETLAIIERALEENISLLTLPPHCTHYLQPLDRTVFGPLKKYYNASCSQFISEHPLHVINKWTFPTLLTQAWNKAFKEENIRSGFSACGIWPIDRTAVPASAFAPSDSTDVPLVEEIPETEEYGDVQQQQLLDTSELLTAVPLKIVESSDENTCTMSDPFLSEAAVFVEPTSSGDFVQDAQPVLDISDPSQLMRLISSGDLLIESLDVGLPETIINLEQTNEGLVSDAINDVFLPPKIYSREPTNSRAPKRKTHTILTSDEVVEQKRQLQIIKEEKEAKKARKIKKEKL